MKYRGFDLDDFLLLLVDFLEANRKSIRSAKRSEKGAK